MLTTAFQSSGFPGFRNDQRNATQVNFMYTSAFYESVCNNLNVLLLRAGLHGGGGPQVGEVTCLCGVKK